MKRLVVLLIIFTSLSLFSQNNRYTVKNISINTEYSDFGVSLYGNNKVVYASTRKDMSPYKNIWKGNHQPYLSLYEGNLKKDGEITNIKLFSETLNTKYHESNTCFTKDLKTVYFSRNNYLNGVFKMSKNRTNLIQLYKAKVGIDGKWTDIEAMPFNSDEYQTGHPALNEAEDKLYFTSDMPGTKGLTDIYMVDIHPDGTYGEPKNLGTLVNTSKKEMFPHIGKGNVLYFSSEGHIGNNGGLDIYQVPLGIDGMPLEKPTNMEWPLNSVNDDFGLVFLDKDQISGYFSSNRVEGKGDDDIYYFKKKPCLQTIVGVIRDKETRRVISNAKVRLIDSAGVELGVFITSSTGEFEFKEVPCSAKYLLEGSKEKYENAREEVKTTLENSKIQKKDLFLSPKKFIMAREKCIVNINPIYFNFDKYDIRRDAAYELNKVVRVMLKYPEIIIEGGSHTDSRGPDRYNEILSQNRANSTVAYIVKKGISVNRISAKGYGEYQLVNKCSNNVKCTELEHQFNRRTEFVITNIEEVQKKYPEICKVDAVSTKKQIKEGVDIIVGPKKNN